jgi:SAM-dependent methyltransferase
LNHRVTRRPYAELADAYNGALGFSTFRAIRSTFERLADRHALRFQSAADLGCGTGLFACFLATRFGVPVYGVDRSPEMLAVARRRCRAPRVQFLHQDIRRFRLPAPVDLATATFDTVNHLLTDSDLDSFLSCVRRQLAPAGHLLFDVLTPIVRVPQGRSFAHQLPSRGSTLHQVLRWDSSRQLLDVRVVRRDEAGTSLERHFERTYAPAQICAALKCHGFSVRDLCDAATLEPPTGHSARVIFVATPSLSTRRNP